ncbi:FAD-dependent oxidoreductase, partial [Nocardioides massiliensis]
MSVDQVDDPGTSTSPTPLGAETHRVVVVGSGFGGLFGTKALRRADVEVTMVAKTTHHLFQPLLYQ